MRWVQAVACLLLAAAVHMHAMDPIQEFMNHDHSQHGQVHEQGQEQHVQGHADRGRHEEEQSDLHLTEHLAEHIRHQAHLNLAAMSTTEKLFHLFLSHDYDSDHLLDGIELIQSLGDGVAVGVGGVCCRCGGRAASREPLAHLGAPPSRTRPSRPAQVRRGRRW
ncbi:uncharacterized protein [Procambarus clarkii]|uniref:uncharacterized protein isoform X3 n=1 Tax=Procambarus clarkii TaxID=6728 RepID=UPI003742B037